MSSFDIAIPVILHHEGLFVNNLNDPGGATNYGISLRWLKNIGDEDGDGFLDGDLDFDGDVDIQDIRRMSQSDASRFYFKHWWRKYEYGEILYQEVATKVLDISVNMGSMQAHKCLQRAARSCGHVLIDDGILGPKTLSAINIIKADSLLPAFRSESAGFYRLISAKKESFKGFLKGWLNRAYT